ncbi:hypothetical protein KW790_01685 [Candidatus Parcubacteria bacterium]|nr:hypothetical protein [Candidatus Parcubacteria bacterium]
MSTLVSLCGAESFWSNGTSKEGISEIVPRVIDGTPSLVLAVFGRKQGEQKWEILAGVSGSAVKDSDLKLEHFRHLMSGEFKYGYAEVMLVRLFCIQMDENEGPKLQKDEPPPKPFRRKHQCSVCGSTEHNKKFHDNKGDNVASTQR